MGVSEKKKKRFCESRGSKPLGNPLGSPSANLLCLTATVPRTPGTAASPCCIRQACALPRMLSGSLSPAMLPRSPARFPALPSLKPPCSFLAPQSLHSNFWDQISRTGRQALICHCPLLCPQGMSPPAPPSTWMPGRAWDRHRCCTPHGLCPRWGRCERCRRTGRSGGAEPSRESGREKPATNNLK